MKSLNQTRGRFARAAIRFVALFFAAGCIVAAHAKPRSPLPPLPEAGVLWQWRCDEAGQWFPLRGAPLEAANIAFAESWSGYALRMSSLTPALLRFPIVDTDGRTNLNCQVGSVRFWFKPDWSSQSLGGKGPGGWARLIEVGAFTDDARFGWWSLHLSPEGDTIHFRAQSGGKTVEFLRADIAWEQGQWHEIALAYDAQSSVIYLDGKPVAQGAGVTLVPGTKAQENLGFAIGSDMAGENLAQGEFDELKTYRQPLAPAQVAWIYECNARQAALGPVSAEEEQLQLLTIQALGSGQMMALSSPSPPPGGGGGGGTNILWEGTNSFSSTNLHLGPPVWTNGNLLMSYGGGDTNLPPYDLFTVTNFPSLTNYANDLVWSWVYRTAQGQTNWTLSSVPYPQAFFLLAGTLDSDGDGLTDAFERLVSKTLTNSVDTDSDGMPDGWEVANGLNPKTNDAAGDLDGDGISNLQEYLYQVNASRPMEPLGPSSRRTGLGISEIMYAPAAGQQAFIEIYNADHLTNNLKGYRISGDVSYKFEDDTLLGPGQFLAIYASQFTAGTLGQTYGRVRLRNKPDAILLEVNYRNDAGWPVAAGGAGHSLVLVRPSFGEDDPRAWGASAAIGGSPGGSEPGGATNSFDLYHLVTINEFLANTNAGQTPFIELYNHSNIPIGLSGCYLSTNAGQLSAFQIPSGTTIAARGFVTFYSGTNSGQLSFNPGANGGTVFFTRPDFQSVIDAVRFPKQAAGVSWGRSPNGAASLQPLASVTAGASNAAPVLPGVVINEIMFNPISGDDNDEFVELFNRSSSSIDLNGWQVHGVGTSNEAVVISGVNSVAAGGFLVLAHRTNIFARYPNLNSGNTAIVLTNNLSNTGQRIGLYNAASNFVDEVFYHDGGRWGQWSDGGGSSLELIDAHADRRLASNWGDSDETAKSAWTTIAVTNTIGVGDNGASPRNTLELGLLDAGECLITNVQFVPSTSTNYITNPGFKSGVAGWGFEGSHSASGFETNGASGMLHLRAVGRVEHLDNRITNKLATAVNSNISAVLSGTARWLRGSPELLVRLRGNGLEAAGRLALPSNLGSPGATNSMARTNLGPAIFEAQHFPVLPAANEPVLVTARVSDPDGIASVALKYRVDPQTNFTNVTMKDDGTSGDPVANDGIFSGLIPGQAAGKIVAFHFQATDGAASSKTNFFPNDAPIRECLVRFGESPSSLSFGTYRLWISQTNADRWALRSKIDSTPNDLTFVYGSNRVIYNAAGMFSSSDINSLYYDSPTNRLCGYSIELPGDDRLLGATGVGLDLSLQDDTGQREELIWWIAGKAGLPFNHRRYVHVSVNGRGSSIRDLPENYIGYSPVKIYRDAQAPGADFLSSWYPDSDQDKGELRKLQVWRKGYQHTHANLDSAAVQNADLVNYIGPGGARDVASYRWNWRRRAAGITNEVITNFFKLISAVNTNGPTYISRVTDEMDVEQWGRILSLERAVGNIDSYGHTNGQNMYAYRTGGQVLPAKWQLLAYDVELGLGAVDASTSESVFAVNRDPVLTRLLTTNLFRRAFWRGFYDMANKDSGPMRTNQVTPIILANRAALQANGYTTTGAALNDWIEGRKDNLRTQYAAVRPCFAFITQSQTTSASQITLQGRAPVEVVKVRVNGIDFDYDLVWTTVTNWQVTVNLTPGATPFTARGYGRDDQPMPTNTQDGTCGGNTDDYTDTITITRQ